MAHTPWSRRLVIFLLALLLFTIVEAVSPALQYRATFIGGWAVREQQCPAGTISCSGNHCCPANTSCHENLGDGYCCPTQDDCLPTLRSSPTCADPSWVLYTAKGANTFFCCEAGEQGIYAPPGEGGVGFCVASGMSVAMTQTASLYTSPAATSGTLSGSGSPASTTQGSTSLIVQTSTSTSAATSAASGASTSSTPKPSSSIGIRNLQAELSFIKTVGVVGIILLFVL